jgi:hypothetical protein
VAFVSTNNASPGGKAKTVSRNIKRLADTTDGGLPDAWKTTNGLDPGSKVGDIDHHGRVNLREYAFKTEPHDRSVQRHPEHGFGHGGRTRHRSMNAPIETTPHRFVQVKVGLR